MKIEKSTEFKKFEKLVKANKISLYERTPKDDRIIVGGKEVFDSWFAPVEIWWQLASGGFFYRTLRASISVLTYRLKGTIWILIFIIRTWYGKGRGKTANTKLAASVGKSFTMIWFLRATLLFLFSGLAKRG